MTEIQRMLFSQQDVGYRAFQSKLIPTVDDSTVIGVRVPALRKLARELAGTKKAADFLDSLPHAYYEENMLHAFLIEAIRDFDACVTALEAFLPYVDNWAVCDSMCPKILGRHKADLLSVNDRWLASAHPYTVRFGIKMLMSHFLDADFQPAYLGQVAAVRSDEYYVNMMVAWYFATALAKQQAATLPYFTEHRLTPWIHQRAVRKAIESYRISDEMKDFLRKL